MRVIVTGGAGFIGSCLIRHILSKTSWEVLCIDKLTYAGSLSSLDTVRDNQRFQFKQIDICDSNAIHNIFQGFQPQAVFHLAAESHVDRSIDSPGDFIQTNIVGTYNLLRESLNHWEDCNQTQRDAFRFLHVSTDEVFGSLGHEGYFTEETSYAPRSPYSASKASADHLVNAWHHTYGLPTLVTNCSNNFGPYQYPEKLIPLCILKALDHAEIPVYGTGENIRDWLYVEDHVEALCSVLMQGKVGETYNIGCQNEYTNLELVRIICQILDEEIPNRAPHNKLITFVRDRPGHDKRYAIDPSKVKRALGWHPKFAFDQALRSTVRWYLENRHWCDRISRQYRGERLGTYQERSDTP